MAYLAKMANLQLATNRANIRQSLNKICNEMAKIPFESRDFDENSDVDQNSHMSHSHMRRQRVHLKAANMTKMARNRSGDFEGDAKYAENG